MLFVTFQLTIELNSDVNTGTGITMDVRTAASTACITWGSDPLHVAGNRLHSEVIDANTCAINMGCLVSGVTKCVF
jgi:hypothetical protein